MSVSEHDLRNVGRHLSVKFLQESIDVVKTSVSDSAVVRLPIIFHPKWDMLTLTKEWMEFTHSGAPGINYSHTSIHRAGTWDEILRHVSNILGFHPAIKPVKEGEKMEIQVGDHVKDIVTGFKGVVVLTGQIQTLGEGKSYFLKVVEQSSYRADQHLEYWDCDFGRLVVLDVPRVDPNDESTHKE